MQEIQIIGAESFGVRSLCTFVKTKKRNYLIDAGVALSPYRYGLKPHLLEFVASYLIRQKILEYAKFSDVIIITHYHRDHFSPPNDFLYGFSSEEVCKNIYKDKLVYAKDWKKNINKSQQYRAFRLFEIIGEKNVIYADSKSFQDVFFSKPLPHGEQNSKAFVLAVCIDTGFKKILFSSDTQFMNEDTIKFIEESKPTEIIGSGPASYHQDIKKNNVDFAINNLLRVCDIVDNLIIDHHIVRDKRCFKLIDEIKNRIGRKEKKICTAAEYMGKRPILLEAFRKELHSTFPVENELYENLYLRQDSVIQNIIKLANEENLITHFENIIRT